ncbi:YheC/YheD family protein [Kroppenstedtia eburnea]|uniref:YheC/YheD family endospore coat-associated protein n=1 Tax=Kroppenstedtia eburnea TaxID=714067 RepID=UPI0002E4C6A6|nr:YheC/YheD family protein [Kroppenstedtia eburnea]QKI82990.1 YheC/YheD family protein [Kroppenstedtia eburnea]
MSEDLLLKSGLFNGTECFSKVEGNSLKLGPLIGLFTSRKHISRLNRQDASFRTLEILKASQKARTVLYHFSIRNLQWNTNTINGTIFNPISQKWEKRILPFPDVLYDRASGRAYRKYEDHVLARNKMDEMKIPKVNAVHYFDKWDLSRHLGRYRDVKEYLPETYKYTPLHLKKMLKRNPIIYLKAAIGSMGTRIMRLESKGNKYKYSVYRKTLQTGQSFSLQRVNHKVADFFGNDQVIMQQGIRLIQVNKGNVDMRATVQRNSKGKLEINSIAVRIGKEGFPITSSRTGSNIVRLDEFMEKHGNHYSDKLEDKIHQFLIRIYQRIEDIYGPFGEMGIDFGVDTSGNIYFIESNAKPAKDSLYQSFDRKTIDRAFRNPMEYAKQLSGFQS